MKSLGLRLLLFGSIVVGLNPAARAATNLPFGVVTPGSITSPAQRNEYTFTANANDMVIFTVTTTSTSFSPKIELYDPNNNEILLAYNNNGFGGCAGGQVLEAGPTKLSIAGVYSLFIGDCADTNVGPYNIYFQRTNNPSLGANLPFGQVTAGKIGGPALNNTYTFTATANDYMELTSVATGSLSPKIRIYNPDGTLLATAYNNNGFGGCAGGTTVEMGPVKLPSSGRYTVLYADCSDLNSGTDNIYIQRVNNPTNPIPILWGELQSGSINTTAQNDTYSFEGTAGDVINFTMVGTGSLSPKIRIYDPAFLLAAYNNNGFGGCAGGTTVELNNFKVPATGPYTILFSDCADSNTGTYTLSTQCLGACLLPAPKLISISPTSAKEGSPALVITVNGASFFPDSVVEWGSAQQHLTTKFVNSGQLTATVPATDLTTPGGYKVCVFTPPPGGGSSNCATFTVTGPAITSLSPASVIVGSPAFTLTVTGNTFSAGCVVQWSGSPLSTTYVSTTELTAAVPAADVTVANPAVPITVKCGTALSPPFYFVVPNPPPGESSLSPSSIIVGGSAFTLTVTGSGFVAGSVVEWDGVALASHFVSSTEMQATVPASDIISGTPTITVHNVAPGGGTSGGVHLTINNPVPVLVTLSPASVVHGAAFTLTMNGYDFNEGAKVLWNGTALTTTFVSDMQLKAAVPAADVAAAGKATITATNPVPTPAASNALTFTIN